MFQLTASTVKHFIFKTANQKLLQRSADLQFHTESKLSRPCSRHSGSQ